MLYCICSAWSGSGKRIFFVCLQTHTLYHNGNQQILTEFSLYIKRTPPKLLPSLSTPPPPFPRPFSLITIYTCTPGGVYFMYIHKPLCTLNKPRTVNSNLDRWRTFLKHSIRFGPHMLKTSILWKIPTNTHSKYVYIDRVSWKYQFKRINRLVL